MFAWTHWIIGLMCLLGKGEKNVHISLGLWESRVIANEYDDFNYDNGNDEAHIVKT